MRGNKRAALAAMCLTAALFTAACVADPAAVLRTPTVYPTFSAAAVTTAVTSVPPTPTVSVSVSPVQAEPPAPQGAPAGEDNILMDFTIVVPQGMGYSTGFSDVAYADDGRYAGGVSRLSYYSDIDNGSYDQLKNNHTSQKGDWEEVDIDFVDGGLWTGHVYKVVRGRFETDAISYMDVEDEERENKFLHTTYFIIFDKEITSLNYYTGEKLKYRTCYALDYVTAFIDHGKTLPVLDEADIMPYVRTFALKDELPYVPPYEWREYEAAGYAKLQAALDAGKPAEAAEMRSAMDGVKPGMEGAIFVSRNMTTDGRARLCEFLFPCDGIIAVIPVDLDTCKARDIVWQRMPEGRAAP